MTRIRALRESINDRFSVLSFSVRADQPLYEIGLATDPALFQREHQAKRTRGNFFASPQLTRVASSNGESVYLVPPSVVARFVGQPRLYFGLATYSDTDRSRPITVRTPDRGTMYVDLAGLTERGLRRTARGVGLNGDAGGYGTTAPALSWGGDAVAPGRNGNGANGHAATPANGTGNGQAEAGANAPSTYSDGYSDELWQQPAPGAPAAATPDPATVAPATPPASEAPATAQGLRARNGQAHPGNGYGPGNGQATAYGHRAGHGGTPARSQSRGRADARELRVVSSYYNPSDWLDALRTQAGFFASSLQWLVGVENTTVMPHSAICQVRRVQGDGTETQHGTAFFIAPNLLLTAAHVVHGQGELVIVPGKNGAGGLPANEPFGRFRVTSADIACHPSYSFATHDFDLALIRVGSSHASTHFFDLVEELTQSRPEGVIACGYAAYSDPQGVIDQIVNATIDPDKQHAHGGFIRSLPSDDTFDYDLQSLGGTSGGPVYYIDTGATPRTHMIGVHVDYQSDTTNLGCRITPAKLAWIRQQAAAWGQSLSFSLGARALSDVATDAIGSADSSDESGYDESEQHGADEHSAEPLDSDATAQAMSHSRSARAHALTAQAPEYAGASRFAAAHANNFRRGRRRGAVVDRIVVHITAGGPNINGTISWFQNGNRVNERTGKPIRTSAHYIVGRDGEVVQMVRNADTAHHASNANARSIGIEHNANKPSRRNGRDLPPTMEQYQASAHLVAWLCAQHGLPVDRTHIVGHAEADHVTNHDCPSSYWDWDTYMQCVQLAAQALAQNSSTGAVPASSQGIRRGAPVRAQEIITPYYDPSDPATALQCQNTAFSQANEEWFVGVDSTHAFPHSAICRLDIKDASGNVLGHGTGFYIGPNRILTAAHNVVVTGIASVDVVPGQNGHGQEPFGRCNTTQWRAAPRYGGTGDFDNDIAVLDNVAIAAPGGHFFTFMHATPSAHMPLVVCGYSAQSRAVPALTAAIDGYKQHLHGGYAAAMESPDTIDYPILSLAGASGSPVYTLREGSNGLEAQICAVHVSGLRASSGVNTGCFITPTKIDWIEGRATTFNYRAPTPAPAMGRNGAYTPPRTASRAPVRAHELITPYYDPSNPASALQCTNDAFSQQREEWFVGVDSTAAFPHSAICHISMVDTLGDTYTGTGFYIGPNRILTCAHNLHQMVSATVTPARNGSGDAPFGQFHLTPSQWRVANGYAGDGDWDRDLAVIDNTAIAAPNGAYFRFMHATPGGTMPLAVCGYSAGSRLVRELNPLIDRNKQHLHGGHAQGQATFDTIDYDILAIAGASGSPVYTVRDEGNGLEAFVCGVHVTRGPIESSGAPSVNRACFITPTKIDWIEGRATAFAYRGPRALSSDSVEHDVRLIPQPDKNACWAASMAMLLGFRGAASVDPEALAREVGGSLSTSYDWDLLTRVSGRHGFVAIEQPSNASLYHAPTQWAQWLRDQGPLWVVIVGAPHAVVLAGIRGDLANPASVEVRVLNPWDTRVSFDNDEVAFNPPNHGQDSWIPFEQFASDFGNMAEPDYGNWRVLHLPATAAPAATAQSFNARGLLLKPAPPSRSMSAPPVDQAIESRVPGMQMHVVRGSAGACKWTLEQAIGTRSPAQASVAVPVPPDQDVTVEINDWPAVQGDASPLPLRVRFKAIAGGGVGNVVIEPGTQVFLAYGVEVHARIDDDVDTNGVAALKVTIDYVFTGEARSAPPARVHLRLFGNGLHERSNQWLDAAQQAA